MSEYLDLAVDEVEDALSDLRWAKRIDGDTKRSALAKINAALTRAQDYVEREIVDDRDLPSADDVCGILKDEPTT